MNSDAAQTLPLMFESSVPDALAWWKTTERVQPKGRWRVALWRSAVVSRLPKDRQPTRAARVRPHACRADGSARVETRQKALAEATKPEFQSLPKIAHVNSREFGNEGLTTKVRGARLA